MNTESAPSQPSAAFDPRQLRDALGRFATGVTIVTTRHGDQDVGLTANSFSSVSLDPPMVLWSLAKSSSSMPAFTDAAYFAVHVLAADQQALSQRFATRNIDRFAGLDMERGEGNTPLLPGSAARFLCRTAFRYEGGDHVIFVGEVVRFEHDPRPPLLFHGGRYALAARRAEALAEVEARDLPPTGFDEDLLGYLVGRAHHQLYGAIRHELAANGLSECSHYALSVLGIADGRTMAEINGLIDYTGHVLDEAELSRLLQAGLIRRERDVVYLTASGRQSLLRLMAIAKAAEADVLGQFDEEETHLLRHLLKRVIRSTDPGIPGLWTIGSPADKAR